MAKAWRRRPLPKFTAKNLFEAFGGPRSLKHDFTEKTASALANMRQATSRDIDKVLFAVNKAIDGFGVEAIRSEKAWDNYYGDSVALYVNTGDTYSASVVYDIGKHQLYVTDYGEWVERNEKLFPRERE